jgi:hypothetical protein
MRAKPTLKKITATRWQTRVYELKDEGHLH